MVEILVHGDNHYIVRGPLPDRVPGVIRYCIGSLFSRGFDN
jgi:hypothetical protein